MPIAIVTPQDRERLVPVTTAIIIDFMSTTAASVRVNNVVVYDGITALAGWFALVVTRPGGTRLILDPPALFAVGDVETVVAHANDDSEVTFIFQTGLRQITTTDDASSPRITEGGPPQPAAANPYWWLKLDDAVGPPVDAQGAVVPTQVGAVSFQQPGIIPAGTAALLHGMTEAFNIASPDVLGDVTERAITITNLTVGVLTDMSVKIVVDTAALIAANLMAPDGGVKFLDSLDNVLSYYIESGVNTATTTYWFRVPSLAVGANAVRMRFSVSENFITFQNKNDVFLFFDDFDGPGLLAQWATTTGTPTIAGGQLQVDAGDGVFAGGFNVPHDSIIESSMRTNGSAVYGAATRVSTTSGNGFVNEGGSNLVGLLVYVNQRMYGETSDGTEGIFGPNYDISGALKKYRIDYRLDGTAFANFDYDNGAGSINRAETSSTNTMHPVIYNGSGQFFVDWYRVYKNPTGKITTVFGADTVVGPGTIPVTPFADPEKAQKFSISGWVKLSGTGAQRVFASSGRAAAKGWVLRMLATNVVEFRAFDGVGSSVVTSTTVIAASLWYHIVAAIDVIGNVMSIYVNSNKEQTIDPAISVISYQRDTGTVDDDLWLGEDPTDMSSQFQGAMDQWRYYPNQVLTDAQVAVLFQESTGALRTPWIGYSRAPGNIYVRKDEPLTSEVLMVPGDQVDLGYDEVKNEIEIVYIDNGKVFIVTGQSSENPSTLTQPSVLKSAFKTGDFSDSRALVLTKLEFPPVKVATPTDGPLKTGDFSDGHVATFIEPPIGIAATPLNPGPAPITVIVGPTTDPLVVSYELWKYHGGSFVPLTTFPASINLSIYLDYAYALGDGYIARPIYRDPGSTAQRRVGPFGTLSLPPTTGGGDLFTTGNFAEGFAFVFTELNFPPIKIATPTDGPFVTGDFSSALESMSDRVWFAPSGTAASLGASFGGFIVVTGLTQMSNQHLYLGLTISGAAAASDNGTFQIVEILSDTSVRVRAVTAAGSDGNNGSLTWSIASPGGGFTAINTLNIGVG